MIVLCFSFCTFKIEYYQKQSVVTKQQQPIMPRYSGVLSDDDYLMSVSDRGGGDDDDDDHDNNLHHDTSRDDDDDNDDDDFDDEEEEEDDNAPAPTSTVPISDKSLGLLTNDQISLLIDDIEDNAGLDPAAFKSGRDNVRLLSSTDPEAAGLSSKQEQQQQQQQDVLVVDAAKPVDNHNESDHHHKDKETWRYYCRDPQWRAAMVLTALVAALVAAIITIVLVHGRAPSSPRTTPAPAGGTFTQDAQGDTLGTATTADDSDTTTTTTTYQAFTTTDELYQAVDEYLRNPTAPALLRRYGPTIGSWQVGQLTNFSRVLEATTVSGQREGRNPAAAAFNADLSGWNVSRATSFYGMFQGEWFV